MGRRGVGGRGDRLGLGKGELGIGKEGERGEPRVLVSHIDEIMEVNIVTNIGSWGS